MPARRRNVLVSAMAALWLMTGALPAAATSPLGYWLSEKGGVVIEILPCGKKLCGRTVWLKKAFTKLGDIRRDENNPDPALRDRPLCGLTVIEGLKPESSGNAWSGGILYEPKRGMRFDIDIETVGDRLRLQAYLGLPILGQEQTWQRPGAEIAIGCADAASSKASS